MPLVCVCVCVLVECERKEPVTGRQRKSIIFRGSRTAASKSDRSARYNEVGARYISIGYCRLNHHTVFGFRGVTSCAFSDFSAVPQHKLYLPTMNSLRICFCLFLTVGWAWSLPSGMDSQSVGHNSIQAKEDLLDGIYSDCINKGSVSCIKYKLFAYVDKALNKDEINLTEGVTVVRSAGSPGDGAPRSLDGGDEQPKDMESLVVKRVVRYLNEHSIKVDIKGADMVNAVSRTGKSISDMVSQFIGDNEEVDSSEDRGIKKSKFIIIIQYFDNH